MAKEAENCSASGLRDLNLLSEYNPDENNIIAELYAPCLRVSERYDRAVGFFRASIYRELGVELLDFAIRGGKTRIICSPDIPEPDENAAREGYALRGTRESEQQESSLVSILETMSRNPEEAECLEMLRLLIERDSLDLFIATRPGGIFHRKIGAFVDHSGDMVVFSGSGNETQKAVSIEDWVNDEEFDVYRTWGDEFEKKKAQRKADYLTKLFSGGTSRTKVRPLNEVEREILNRFRSHSNLEDCRLGAHMRSQRILAPIASPNVDPYYYQLQAIESWEKSGRRGILSMATGTGKTITAIWAIKNIVKDGHPTLILVPSKILFNQWLENLRFSFPSVPILLAGAGHDWKSENAKRMYISDIKLPRLILATMHTAASNDFIEFFSQAHEPILVADEVHRLGSPIHRKILSLKFWALLGLSATPERQFDNEGSIALDNAFGESPVYNLPMGASVHLNKDDDKEVKILGHFLAKYSYDFVCAYLTANEQEKWGKITNEIKRRTAIEHSSNKDQKEQTCSERIKFLLMQRAEIIKTAKNKVDVTSKVVKEKYPANGRWIIYCDDKIQLDQITTKIKSEIPHVAILKYHSEMSSQERERSLTFFESNPSIIVSIKCLDEGVDIPSADGAVIVASSKNPREYIQRRGRLLRRAKGKRTAHIIDVITLPISEEGEEDVSFSIIRGELARAYIFAKDAINPEITHSLWKICGEYNVHLETDTDMSLEEDEWEE